jgi:uncharacterized membrane protein
MRLERRPVIKLSLSVSDKIAELSALLTLFVLWALVLLNYQHLPETIPNHFNASGQANGYGPKSSIFTLPILGAILFVLITLVNRFPQFFNYLNKITSENALEEYTTATRMLRYLKLFILIILLVIVLIAMH